MSDERPRNGMSTGGDQEALSDYLLGELDPAGRRRIERRLAQDGALRAQMARLAPLVAQLEELPDDAWQLTGVQRDARQAPGDPLATQAATTTANQGPALGRIGRSRPPVDRPRWWQRPLAVRPILAAAAAIALLAIGVGAGVLLKRTPREGGQTVALRPLPGQPTTAIAHAQLTRDGHMLLRIQELPAPKPGTYYEAWLMTNTTRLVPVVAFRPDTNGSVQINVPLPAASTSYRYIDISLQHTDAGAAHSHHSVLRGNT